MIVVDLWFIRTVHVEVEVSMYAGVVIRHLSKTVVVEGILEIGVGGGALMMVCV